MTEFAPQFDHERYEELCALATAGVLTPAESEVLTLHLRGCAECREAFAQYQNIAKEGMPYLAEQFAAPANVNGFDESSALDRLMQATENTKLQPAPLMVTANRKRLWNRGWVRGLAAAFLLSAVGLEAYWTGAHSAGDRLHGLSTQWQSAESSLERVVAEKKLLEKVIGARQQQMSVLEQQAITDKNDMAELRKEADSDAERIVALTGEINAAKKDARAQLAAMTQERDTSTNKLRDAEKMYQTVQDELNTLRSQHRQDLVRLASLQTNLNSTAAELNVQNMRAKTDEQDLSSDKDIRDLIGARNLYIADIVDVNESGKSRKPFGRVFYTKTKSLIFYAYDLDRQPGVLRASTFQVWGRAGAGDREAINLGILYMDSETNRRWTLRVNNPEQLARLDAVFVTIEPREQSDKPTGKPFLYASLRREPNHP